jgi:acetaldehyde dehydrogenase/alcohol dehydrogenase
MAGMAFANAFLGLCHSMAHKLGATFHLPHGLANALLICEVIRFNATDSPRKQAAFPQYEYPHAKARYARLARLLELPGEDDDELVESLIESLETLKRQLDIPDSIQAAGVPEEEFLAKLDELSEEAFDDQCTGANPRYPLMSEIRQLLLNAYYGSSDALAAGRTTCEAAA